MGLVLTPALEGRNSGLSLPQLQSEFSALLSHVGPKL